MRALFYLPKNIMASSQELLGQLQSFQATRRKPQDILAEQENKLGVSGVRQRQAGLRGAIQNTENLLGAVDPSVTGRTSNSLVTEAQRTKMVANERAPIAEQFTEQSRALEGESANLAELGRQASTAAQLAIGADDQQQNYLQSLYSSTYQQEKDERDRQEQVRQFNENLALQKAAEARATRAASSGGGLYGLGSGGGAQAPQSSGQSNEKQRAQADVNNLLAKDGKRIQSEYEAIKKSAGYGNAYDRIKLQLIEHLYPAAKNFGKNSVSMGTNRPTIVSLSPSSSPGRVVSANQGSIRF